MSLVINHNLTAERISNQLSSHYAQLGKSTQRLSSGLRINGAADDAAGLAIRELMRADVAALGQGMRNTNDAISMLQTMDGALGIIDEKLIRMKELAEQAATGTYDSTQRAMIDSEFQQMASEIDRIARATDFNGIKLLDGNFSTSSSSSGTGSDNIQYRTTISPQNYVEENYADRSKLPQGTSNFVIKNSKYAYFEGTDDALSLSVDAGDLSGQSFNITWNGSRWVINTEATNRYLDNAEFYHPTGGWKEGDYTIYNSDTIDIRSSNGGIQSFVLTVKDSNGNTISPSQRSAIANKTVNANVDDLTNPGTPTLTKTSGPGTISLSGNDLIIDVGDGNTLTKRNATNTSVIKFSLTVNKIENQEDEPEPIPDNVVKIHFGPGNDSSEDYYYIDKSDATLKGLGIKYMSIETQEYAQKALKRLDDAIVKKDQIRAYYGAMQNRLENTMTNLQVQAQNLQSAESRISDADVATEMTNFIRNQILTQSAVAMLAQANSMPQMAMRLIE